MRVTNSMISNSAKGHISNAKSALLKYEEQFTSEKKIQRPSDDPTVAVRALKYRSTVAQITQYVEKNVQDAMSWMDTTESALKNINSILVNMKGYLNEGANDYLASDERASVLSVLQQYVSSIFEDEANSDYSGRYVFTGYRTDTSLLFDSATKNLAYDITENFNYTDVSAVNVVTGKVSYDENATDAQDYADQMAEIQKQSFYKVTLAYKDCSAYSYDNVTDGNDTNNAAEDYVTLTTGSYKDANGNTVKDTYTATTKASTDADAYTFEKDEEVIYLYDTGELLLRKDVYSSLQENQVSFSVNYCKTEFDKSDIRPEMYFQCNSYNTVSKKEITYSDPDGQDIKYEVNFSQNMTVNTQDKDAIDTDIYRTIDYLTKAIEDVDDVENRISDAEKMIANTTDEGELEVLNAYKESLETEKSLRVTVMTEAFGIGLSMVDSTQETLNVALADLGTRYNRLELTYDKLSNQKVDVEEQLSNNEDVDISDAYINLTQADNLYQYSLTATSKILGNTLLDYI
jgi:flagellar hook-associated protein 3 FlgL